jgi:hypothetical protein
MTGLVKFEVGATYFTRSICDHNCIISGTVTARTAKTVKVDLGSHRGVKTFRVHDWNGAEAFSPWGRGSMMPTLRATDTRELKPDWEK